ncbi:uncharacterized protein fam217bb isoform X1 [Lates calcarifer]|uniref:Uncharacterized protein fam217bb isoform X1 n=1 Tax=Lates calcarifer TaxID=8187 RepID=A0A4W6D3Q2_LATCA|nr:uncharacterized protein fam217bb isoform X1 [Lates calcarifer]
MGTFLQQRVPQQCVERFFMRERVGDEGVVEQQRANVGRNKMGRKSQRKSLQPQNTFPSQENNHDKRLQQRRKHKFHTPRIKCNTCQHSIQETLDSKTHSVSPVEDRMEPEVQPAVKCSDHREQKHTGIKGSRHTPGFPCHHQSDSRPDLLERHSPNLHIGGLSGHEEAESDTDLSESERLTILISGQVPPQLELRPDVIETEDCSIRSHGPKRQGCGSFDFPDFLPPPFNSWSFSQLAVFYNMEEPGGPRHRPVGSLERYLERLLQLEWHQIQTVQEENGKSELSDVISSCHRSPAAASSRLSSPKCILQCQRAFPLTFLSSLACHSTLLPSCACGLYRIRHSTHSHTRQSRLSPMMECRGPMSLPIRSYSESRMHYSDRSAVSRAERFSSHLRRMQAFGNIRNPVQGANTKPHSTARDLSVGARRECLGAWGDVLDYRTGGLKKRSGSEQRRSAEVERQKRSEKRKSGSECSRGGSERGRTAEFKKQE